MRNLANLGLWAAAPLLAIVGCGLPLTDAAAQLQQRNMPPQATTPTPAPSSSTGFRVCNKTGAQIEVAKAVNTSTDGKPPFFISEGWYQLTAGECATLWAGELKYRYYLLYAQNKQSKREWAGNINVCVSQQPFTIQHGYCEQGSYQRKFFQVDTGDYKSWTQSFTD